MKTVGIDISLTNTGVLSYVHGRDHNVFGQISASEVFGYSLSSRAVPADRVRRLKSLSESVLTFLKNEAPDFVAIEGPSYMSQSRQFDLGGAHYFIYAAVLEYGAHPAVMPPTRARRLALGAGAPPGSFPKGKGRVKKWVAARLHEVTGVEPPGNEHLRDALVLCLAQQGWFPE